MAKKGVSIENSTINKREWHELRYAASYLGVKEWEVLKAIQELKSNKRAFIYAYFKSLKT